MWWHDFFDEDALWLYGPTLDAERTEHEVAGVARLARLKEGERVADLGCGGGRHAVALQRRGLKLVAVEWSPAALEAAGHRAVRVGAHPSFVRADLRALPIRTASCDAALSLFSTLGYESDDETLCFLAEAGRILRPGGRLVVEVMGRDRAVRDFSARREWTEVDGRIVRIERRIDLVAGEERATFIFDRGAGEKRKPFRRRLFTPTELSKLLVSSGFSRVDFFGDYEGTPLTLDSPHLVAVARP